MPDARAPRRRPFPGDPAPQRPPARPKGPPLDLEVVEWLERTFPEPALAESGALLHALGARSVARFVRAEYTRQQRET